MRRFAPCLPLLALVGCAGSVTLEDVDSFGGGASAVWFHSDDSNYDSILLTNVVGACGKWQAYAQAQEDYADATEDIDADDWCEEAEAPTKAFARATNALFHEGVHSLSLTVFGDGTTVPDEDTYEVLDLTALLYGQMTYYESSPSAAILRDWDPSDDLDDGCGVDEDDLELDSTTWILSDGELEIDAVSDEKGLQATLDGELVDDDGDDAGTITAVMSATWCEVDL